MVELDDNALLRRAKEDPSGPAFQELFERHKRGVFRFLGGLLQDRDLAEDVLQDTFFRVYKALDRYDFERPFQPWLYRIARNTGLNAIRDRGRKNASEPTGPDPTAEVIDDVAQREVIDEARQALRVIPPETRALLLQRHGLGMKLADLATSWGCTERTVRNRLHAGADALARAIVSERASARRRPV